MEKFLFNAVLAGMVLPGGPALAATPKPNLILIYSDDHVNLTGVKATKPARKANRKADVAPAVTNAAPKVVTE